MTLTKIDVNTDEEKATVEQVFNSAIQCLSEEDRSLPAIELILPILKRGVGVHHSGLLPILKEIIEILFQEGLIKILFATETFAMGLNMPAKTVVFTQMRKWDGDGHRWMAPGEYIQMSGRAGRRGKDERGISIVMMDEQMDMTTCRDVMLGQPAPLVSTFHLSYYTLLNLMSRAGGEHDTEYVIRNSFHQFQHDRQLPQVEARLKELEEQAAAIPLEGDQAQAESFHALRRDLIHLEHQLLEHILRPDRSLRFLTPGRLIRVRNKADEWGWGVVCNVVKRPPPANITPAAAAQTPPAGAYLIDTLLLCAPPEKGTEGQKAQPQRPRPCPKGTRGEMQVVPVQLPLVSAISTLKVVLPNDLRPPDARASVQVSIAALKRKFPDGLPRLDPVEDMQIDDPDMHKVVREMEEKEAQLLKHPLFTVGVEGAAHAALKARASLEADAAKLRVRMKESQLQMFKDELRSRARVLKRLNCIDQDGVVQLKGRAACLIDTADELLLTELMFNGVFNSLDHHQVVALASCFMQMDKSNEQVKLKEELVVPLRSLQETARQIATIANEAGLKQDPDEYAESFKPFLMDVVYAWSKGASFEEVTKMTDMFEGSIIRATRRLDELINQLRDAAKAVGDEGLQKKFEQGSDSIRRGLMFANSLYL